MFTTMQVEAVHAIFLCFLEAAQNANLEIAFLSAGPLSTYISPAMHGKFVNVPKHAKKNLLNIVDMSYLYRVLSQFKDFLKVSKLAG